MSIIRKSVQATEQSGDLAHLIRERGRGVPAADATESDQASLARRLRNGGRAAAEELVDNYHARIYLFMRAVGHDPQTSEDLTQETFMKAWAHVGQLREGKALSSWLFRIAGNVTRLYWRRHKGREEVGLDQVPPAAGGVDALENASEQEQFTRLRETVAQLPWKLRQAIVLHYMDELTIGEAAEAAGVREGTLKSRLNRALAALRKSLVDR